MKEKIDSLFAEACLRSHPEASKEVFLFLESLMEASREGHLFLPKDPALQLPLQLFEEILHLEENRVYLKCNWENEKLFLKHLKRIQEGRPPSLSLDQLDLQRFQLLLEQRKAVISALSSTLTLIVGGPGTGKTYTAQTIATLFSELSSGKIAIAAPTGKAAGNLRKKLGKHTIKTLHSLVNERYLPYDLIIVDEGSMIDASLLASFFSFVKDDSRVVILGDKDQLPAVEQGSFFADLTACKGINVIHLSKSMRAELQEILELAAAVNCGKMVPFQSLPDQREIIHKVLKEFSEVNFEALHRFRLLTPLRVGPFGVRALNLKIHEEHQKMKGEHPIPIMILENDEELNLFNGDIALLRGTKVFLEDGREMSLHQIPRYELAYTISVHKAQGSEFDEVMVLIPPGSETFGREMLYTAITRAKKKIDLYACETTLRKMIEKRSLRRSTINDI